MTVVLTQRTILLVGPPLYSLCRVSWFLFRSRYRNAVWTLGLDLGLRGNPRVP